MGGRLNQTTVRPDPDDIIVYEINTVPDTRSNFRTVITSASRFGKLVSVSACPGDVKQTIVSATPESRCSSLSTQNSSLTLTTYQDDEFRCILQPNRTYYINVYSDLSMDPNDNAKSCTDSAHCSLKAEDNVLLRP